MVRKRKMAKKVDFVDLDAMREEQKNDKSNKKKMQFLSQENIDDLWIGD